MWTTTDEEVIVPPGEGDKKNCAFYPKSSLYNGLLAIPNVTAQSLFSDNYAPLQVLGVQTSDGPSNSSPMVEPLTNLTRIGLGPPQAAFLTTQPRPSMGPTPMATVELASGPDIMLASRVKDGNNLTDHGDHYPDLKKTPSDPLPPEASDEPENSPCSNAKFKSLDKISTEQAKYESSVRNVTRQDSPEFPSIVESERFARQSLFLTMQVPRRDTSFFGREELLITLEDLVVPVFVPRDSQLESLGRGTVIVLHGPGGVGKSAIALELTYRTEAAFDYVLWLCANSKIHLAQSFHEAAVSLRLVQDRRDHNHESSRQKLIAWLSTTSSKWLLVFDDADDLQILSQFMPNPRRGSIIVTNRQPFRAGPDINEDEYVHTFQVDPFVVEDATAFILSLAPCAVDAAHPAAADVATLATIAEDCGCLPLTLRRVGTIINRRGSIKVRQIMATLEKHASRVLASQPLNPFEYAGLSSASLALATVITFLDPYCIDDAILLGAQCYKSVPLTAFPMKDVDYFDAKNELIAHALLAVGTDPSAINIHRVTAKSLRGKLEPDNFSKGFQSACRLLEARWPSRRKMKNIVLGNWPEFDSLHSHVHSLSDCFKEQHVTRKKGDIEREVSNEHSNGIDSFLGLLFLSTWYNARRGNAEEDKALVRLAHGLIARSQRPNPTLAQSETFSTTLPARFIDVGLDNTQCPRLVDTAGQTGCYVALSCCWPSRSFSETQLTKSNMSRLQQSIEPTGTPRYVFDAISFTRSLGVRYIWVDSLCVVQDEWKETLPRMSDIYRSAVLTIAAVGGTDETVGSCIDSSVLEQPFSIFLDWSRPVVAKSLSHRLFTPNAFSHVCGARLSLLRLLEEITTAHDIIVATQANGSGSPHENIADSDRLSGAESAQLDLEPNDIRFDLAIREIAQGIRYVEAGNILEALALFMKARELVSAFQKLAPRSWGLHAAASANIDLVYQMQRLPARALDIAEASLAVQKRLPKGENISTLEKAT